jgi:hypothetical protein
MKKIFIIALAVMMVAGMAYAEDRLSLNGSLRLRGWDNEAATAAGGNDWNSDTEESFFDSRFRVGGKIAVADDVSVNFRMDFGDTSWGLGYPPSLAAARPRGADKMTTANTIDIDRAYISVKKDMWELDAGQHYMGLGIAEVFDLNATGFTFRLKFDPVKISLLYAKVNEGGSLSDATSAEEDIDAYAANVGFASDTFDVKAFYAMLKDQSDTDDSPSAFGLNGGLRLGMVNLLGELALFGGDDGAGTDYMGTQFYIKADAAITEMITIGAEGFYAMGTEDANEEQKAYLTDWASFVPMSANTPQDGDFSAFSTWTPFMVDQNTGSIGGTLFADFAIMEGLSAGAKVGYFTAETDIIDRIETITAWNAYIKYMIATNTNLSVSYFNSTPDYNGDGVYQDDTAKILITQLVVNF